MNIRTNKGRKLAALTLSLTCLGSFSALGYAGMKQQPLAIFTSTNPAAPPQGQLPPGPPPDGKFGGMQDSANDASQLTAQKICQQGTETLTGQNYTAARTDESAVLVRQGAVLNLQQATLRKTGDTSSADASNFTGQNAIILVNNSQANLENLTLTSDADGANAVFSTGAQSVVNAKHLVIHTKNNSSRGLDATYGGTINAEDVDITTEGAHCGALATDRGEGNVIVNGAKIKTSGEGSPCIYSTGNIQLTNGIGEASGSEIAVVEGKNSITLQNSTLTGHIKHGVMLYQSFSGDANVGVARFTAKNSTLNNKSAGPMFYVTNTTAEAALENTELIQAGDILVKVASDRWGSTGQNGGDFTLNAQQQRLQGRIIADNISKVTLKLGPAAEFTGTINDDYQAETAHVSLAQNAVWNLTADAYVSTITDAAADFSNINSNHHNIYYDKDSNPSLKGQTIALPGGGKLIAK